MIKDELVILVDESANKEMVECLSEKLSNEVITGEEVIDESKMILQIKGNEISLKGNGMELCGDYTKMIKRIKQSNLSNELLVKASKIRDKQGELVAIDATAGMGEDSLLLAAAGFKVKLYENDPIIAVLLKNTIERAKDVPELKEIVERMDVFEHDSIEAMNRLEEPPDVIFLDPMFPERTKSALIKKKFQILHFLEKPCSNEKEMLEAALKAHPHKIVIKRPLKSEYLGEIKPSYSIKGKAIRYDCIVLPRLNEK